MPLQSLLLEKKDDFFCYPLVSRLVIDVFMRDLKLEKCIEEVKAGQTGSFSYIVDKYQGLAINIALSIVKNAEDAEEVAQDAFVKVFRFIHQYNGESRFSIWLYKVVYNTALSKANTNSRQLYKRENIKKNLTSTQSVFEEDRDVLEREDTKAIIAKGMDHLYPDDKLILTLFYLAEKSLEEIAEITDWKKSNCKVKLMRARKRLKEVLSNKKEELI